MKFYVCVREDRIYSEQASTNLVADKGEYLLGPYGMLKAIQVVKRHGDNPSELYRRLNSKRIRGFMQRIVGSRVPPEFDRRRRVKPIRDTDAGFENRVKRLEDTF